MVERGGGGAEGRSFDKWFAAYEVMEQVGDKSQEGIRRQKVKSRAAVGYPGKVWK